jgi:hypothetical protein
VRVALEVQQFLPSYFVVGQTSKWIGQELLRYEAMTGLTDEQLTDLAVRVHSVCADKFVSRGRPIAVGLFRSVAMVVCLMRKNVTQDFAGAVFGVSQSTVSRRWDLLRPLIGDALAEVVPDPSRGLRSRNGAGRRHAVPDLGLASRAGAVLRQDRLSRPELQIAATLDGELAAVGPVPVHGARHDAYAFAASGLAEVLTDHPTITPRWPIWATSASRASPPSRTSDSPASTSASARSRSTPR